MRWRQVRVVAVHASWCCGSVVSGIGGMWAWCDAIGCIECSPVVGSSQCGEHRRRMVCAVWHESAMCVFRYGGRLMWVCGVFSDAALRVCGGAPAALR